MEASVGQEGDSPSSSSSQEAHVAPNGTSGQGRLMGFVAGGGVKEALF